MNICRLFDALPKQITYEIKALRDKKGAKFM